MIGHLINLIKDDKVDSKFSYSNMGNNYLVFNIMIHANYYSISLSNKVRCYIEIYDSGIGIRLFKKIEIGSKYIFGIDVILYKRIESQKMSEYMFDMQGIQYQ